MASAMTEDTFHPFPKLSPELRLKIWRSSFPGPRLIRISLIEGHFMSNATIPTGLHVCKESRDETLIFYKLCFAANPSDARIYFNVDCDVPHLNTQPLNPGFHQAYVYQPLFTTQNMGPSLATYLRLFSIAHAAIRNDIKAVCVEDKRFFNGEYEAPPMPLFGPDCQVFSFQGISFRTQELQGFEFPQQSSRQHARARDTFGTSKYVNISGHLPCLPVRPLLSAPLASLFEQVCAADYHGFNDIVWQFIERKVNTTREESRQVSMIQRLAM